MTSQTPFVVLDEYGVENAKGTFESVIVKECETKRAALKAARDYVTIHPDKSMLITRGHSQRFEDMLTYVYVDDLGRITTESSVNAMTNAMTTTKTLEASDNVACQAFALCENPAEGACQHPVLGYYLSCTRCADRLEKILYTAEIELVA